MAQAPIDSSDLRFLEIGTGVYFKLAFPAQTRLLRTDRRLGDDLGEPFSLRAAWRAWRDIRAGKFDLIVVWPTPYAPWNWRELKAVISLPFRPLSSLIRVFGIQALRFTRTRTPIVVLDLDDTRTIARHNLFLLDRAKYFFKRELPIDRWQVLQHTQHAGLPRGRFRARPKNRRRIEKLRPISIGAYHLDPIARELPFPDKAVDVFAGLALENTTTTRTEGIRQLRALAGAGVVVDIAEKRLSGAEFMERMSRAWLTWSPEGFGWDCYRHYEAPIAFSVPVINGPTIVRYEPLVEGVHAFFYQPDEAESLGRVIRQALGDKQRLRDMALRARNHVLDHHIRPRPFADIIWRTSLVLDDAPGGIVLDD